MLTVCFSLELLTAEFVQVHFVCGLEDSSEGGFQKGNQSHRILTPVGYEYVPKSKAYLFEDLHQFALSLRISVGERSIQAFLAA
ncbi:MAG: hypothetical protein ABIM21_02000 [candidate division WOR-3 bacterium]